MDSVSASTGTTKKEENAKNTASLPVPTLPQILLLSAVLLLSGTAKNVNVCLAQTAVFHVFLATNASSADLATTLTLSASDASKIAVTASDLP